MARLHPVPLPCSTALLEVPQAATGHLPMAEVPLSLCREELQPVGKIKAWKWLKGGRSRPNEGDDHPFTGPWVPLSLAPHHWAPRAHYPRSAGGDISPPQAPRTPQQPGAAARPSF